MRAYHAWRLRCARLRWRARRRPGVVGALVGLAVLGAGCRQAPDLPGAPLDVALVEATDGRLARVRVSGLSTPELDELRQATWTTADWGALLRVAVGDDTSIAVAGRYAVTATGVEFVPAFPFDPGRTYVVHLDPSRLPTPRARAPFSVSVTPAAGDPPPASTVSSVYPSGDVWPENLLRFYIHFTQPMARQSGVPYIRLLDADGVEVPEALLQAPVDFWSPDQRRYTVFFDPGRVKTDLVPNQHLGRALVAGRRYTIAVAADWPDAQGRPLAEEYRLDFTAGPAIARPLRLSDWTLSTPAAGTREPLVVTVPWPLDRALFLRTLGVETDGRPVEGDAVVTDEETVWMFTPVESWTPAPHALVVLSVLEDPSGNLIDQAFEVDPREAPNAAARPERYTVAFQPR